MNQLSYWILQNVYSEHGGRFNNNFLKSKKKEKKTCIKFQFKAQLESVKHVMGNSTPIIKLTM